MLYIVDLLYTLIYFTLPISVLLIVSILTYVSVLNNKVNKNIDLIIKETYNLKSLNKDMDVNIDFDNSSEMWRLNKYVLKNGCYKYKKSFNCKGLTKQGTKCKNKTAFDYCYLHEKICPSTIVS